MKAHQFCLFLDDFTAFDLKKSQHSITEAACMLENKSLVFLLVQMDTHMMFVGGDS